MTSSTSNSVTADNAITLKRSHAWGFLTAAMEYPEGELAALIRAGDIEKKARELFCDIYPELAEEINWNALSDAGKDDELSVEYTRLFDVGGSDGPFCCLNSGAIKGDSRMALLEELVRFYNYFGLTAAETVANELPDHLSTQFEFMHYLSHREAECAEAGESGDDYLRAQRDFLNRHPNSWVSLLNDRLKEHKAPAYYQALGELMHRYVQFELHRLEGIVSTLPPPEAHAEPAETASTSSQAQGMDAPTSVITIHRKAPKVEQV